MTATHAKTLTDVKPKYVDDPELNAVAKAFDKVKTDAQRASLRANIDYLADLIAQEPQTPTGVTLMAKVLADSHAQQKATKNWRTVVVISMLITAVTSGVLFGLMIASAEVTKEMHVRSDGVLVGDTAEDVVSTSCVVPNFDVTLDATSNGRQLSSCEPGDTFAGTVKREQIEQIGDMARKELCGKQVEIKFGDAGPTTGMQLDVTDLTGKGGKVNGKEFTYGDSATKKDWRKVRKQLDNNGKADVFENTEGCENPEGCYLLKPVKAAETDGSVTGSSSSLSVTVTDDNCDTTVRYIGSTVEVKCFDTDTGMKVTMEGTMMPVGNVETIKAFTVTCPPEAWRTDLPCIFEA